MEDIDELWHNLWILDNNRYVQVQHILLASGWKASSALSSATWSKDDIMHYSLDEALREEASIQNQELYWDE